MRILKLWPLKCNVNAVMGHKSSFVPAVLPFHLIIPGITQWKQCIFSYEIPAKSPGLRQEGKLGKGSRTKLWYVNHVQNMKS